MENVDASWVSVKTRPNEFIRVQMKCLDGIIRWGVFDPESFHPWIYENECLESPLDMPQFTHWRPI